MAVSPAWQLPCRWPGDGRVLSGGFKPEPSSCHRRWQGTGLSPGVAVLCHPSKGVGGSVNPRGHSVPPAALRVTVTFWGAPGGGAAFPVLGSRFCVPGSDSRFWVPGSALPVLRSRLGFPARIPGSPLPVLRSRRSQAAPRRPSPEAAEPALPAGNRLRQHRGAAPPPAPAPAAPRAREGTAGAPGQPLRVGAAGISGPRLRVRDAAPDGRTGNFGTAAPGGRTGNFGSSVPGGYRRNFGTQLREGAPGISGCTSGWVPQEFRDAENRQTQHQAGTG